ncbi:Poxvirus protein I5 [Promicromonospora panici]|uniref:Poxvirus protein I5 n=1 Tax=Promicromonospora panici TaxID=2219658 RepID=UPI00101D37EC|nr:Poxvirus protein I5 [Promicromonospora panici]
MNSHERADEPDEQPTRGRRVAGEGWFALLGETLLTGLLTLVGSLPVVTAPAALAAGAAHLRRHLGGYDTSVRFFFHDWLAAARSLWALGVLIPLAAVAVWVNTGLTASGELPGGSVVRWVTWAAAACAAVVVVRAAAAWSDDDRPAGSVGLWWELSRGVVRTREDLSGSALLLAALVMCAVLVWMLLPLVLVTGGLLSLAATAVEARRLNRL